MDNVHNDAVRKPPHKSSLFWVIVVGIALVIYLFVSLMKGVPSFSQDFKDFLEKYQIIITLSGTGLGILIQWYITHYNNRPSTLEEQNLISQYLRNEYIAGEQYFVKIFGKRVSDYAFTYISVNDLPVIYSKLYEEERLIEKGKIAVNNDLVDVLKQYFQGTEKALDGFFEVYNKEVSKDSPNPNIKESYIFQLMEFLHRNLLFLHQNIGVKFIALSDASIKTYQSAFYETLHLVDYLEGDFKELGDSIINRESTAQSNSQEDIQKLFESANNIAEELMGTSGEATFEGFYQGVQIRRVIKQANGSKLYNLALQVIHDVVEKLQESNKSRKIVEEEDKYPSYSFYNEAEDKHLTLRYRETDDNTLLLTLDGGEKQVAAVVKFVDEEQTKYMVDRDMGEFFITECGNEIERSIG